MPQELNVEDAQAVPGHVASTDQLGGSVPERDTYDKPPHGWTCFHCGETFTTVRGARTHFGAHPDAEPGCLVRVALGAERGLLAALRKAEDECRRAWETVHGESTDAHKAMYAMQSRHADALRDAEELGYARGLHDTEQAMREQQRSVRAAIQEAEGVHEDA